MKRNHTIIHKGEHLEILLPWQQRVAGLRTGFGNHDLWNGLGWGAAPDEARKMLDIYLEHGGNFVDTASGYTNGSSEKILGDILDERIVLATKYTLNLHPGPILAATTA